MRKKRIFCICIPKAERMHCKQSEWIANTSWKDGWCRADVSRILRMHCACVAFELLRYKKPSAYRRSLAPVFCQSRVWPRPTVFFLFFPGALARVVQLDSYVVGWKQQSDGIFDNPWYIGVYSSRTRRQLTWVQFWPHYIYNLGLPLSNRYWFANYTICIRYIFGLHSYNS